MQRAPAGEQYGYDCHRYESYKRPVTTLKDFHSYDGGKLMASCELDVKDILSPDPFGASPTSTYEDRDLFAGPDDPPLVLHEYSYMVSWRNGKMKLRSKSLTKQQVILKVPTENLLGLFSTPKPSSDFYEENRLAKFLEVVCERAIEDPAKLALRTTALNMIDWGLRIKLPRYDPFVGIAVEWCLKFEDNRLLNQVIERGITKRGGNASILLNTVANHEACLAEVDQPNWQERYVC